MGMSSCRGSELGLVVALLLHVLRGSRSKHQIQAQDRRSNHLPQILGLHQFSSYKMDVRIKWILGIFSIAWNINSLKAGGIL